MRKIKLLIVLCLASLQLTFLAAANGPKHPDAKRRGGAPAAPEKAGRWSGEQKRENVMRPPERAGTEGKSTTREERRPGASGRTREKASAWDRSLQRVETRRTTDGKSPESKFTERDKRSNSGRNVDKASRWERRLREKARGARSERAQLLEHVFHGELVKGKVAKGFHYEGAGMQATNGTKIIEGTRTATDARGVYEARVTVRGIEKEKRSSFFPRSWSKADVVKAVNEAQSNMRAVNPRRPNYYEGRTSSGMTIGMLCNVNKQPVTAYPLYGK